MASKSASVIGVELHESAIRAVQVSYRGGKGKILGWSSIPLPERAFQEGVVHDAAAVAIALKHLLESMGVQGMPIAVGVADQTQLRNLVVPPVPPDELGIVVDVEIEHQQVLRSAHTLYSYLPLASPNRNDRQVENVAVFTASEEVFAALRAVAEQSDIKIEAVEPTVYAMHRAAWLHATGTDVTFTLSIGSRFSEAGFVHKGELVSYRRVEVGSISLLRGGMPTSMPPVVGQRTEADQPSADARHINVDELDLLCTEIRRILDYLSREYPGLPTIDQVQLTIENEGLAPISNEISRIIGLPVELVNPLKTAKNPPDVTSGATYSAAYGLAMRGSQSSDRAAPAIDLYAQERRAKTEGESRKNLLGSIIVSAVAVGLGVAAYLLYGYQIANTQAATKADLDKASQIRSETDVELAGRARRSQQYRALRREGIPITAILSAVARNLDPDAGVSSITVDNNFKVTISGEAVSEGPMIRSVQMLQQSPILRDLTIDSFSRQNNSDGITYQISARTVPLSQIALPETSTQQGGQ